MTHKWNYNLNNKIENICKGPKQKLNWKIQSMNWKLRVLTANLVQQKNQWTQTIKLKSFSQNSKKKMTKKSEGSLRDLLDTMKQTNILIIPQEKDKSDWKLPKYREGGRHPDSRSPVKPHRNNPKHSVTKHMIIKLSKVKNKNKTKKKTSQTNQRKITSNTKAAS